MFPAQPRQLVTTLLLCSAAASVLAQKPVPAQAVILQYHHVSTATPPSTSISPADFRTHMAYLRDNGFHIERLETVLDALQNGTPLPDKTAVLTFDDGYQSVYTDAFPLLREYDWPFTIFVTTGLVSSNPRLYASWEQLAEMGAGGATLANHSVSHPYMLEHLPGEDDSAWLARLEQEIVVAEEELVRHTGQNHRLFAYPYGEYDPQIQALVTELGYVGIGQHSGPINATSDFSALPRFPFSGVYASMNTYPTKVNSLVFDVQLLSPPSPVSAEKRPQAVLQFEGEYRLDALTCYHNDSPMQLHVEDAAASQIYRLQPVQDNNNRRWRYNCTAPGQDGRFYWYSIPWTNPTIAE